MGWYDRAVVPHIIRLGCGCRMMAEHRQKIVPLAKGRVLELGMGAGANLPFYDAGRVSEVVGVEPSPGLRAMAAAAPRAQGLAVRIEEGVGEALPFDAGGFDTVVCTFTLCSVADPARTLAEARRVLRPGGTLLFHEHGGAPDAGVARWQRRIEPLWKRVFGGCHLTRPVGGSIAGHFTVEQVEGFYAPGMPRFAAWMEAGRAVAA
jgi:SAM-dependent methyltransferase